MNNLLTKDRLKGEADMLLTKSDKQLVDYIVDVISGSAILASRGRPYNTYDQKVDLAYDECQRRGKPELYTRGYERVKKSFGY